MTTAEAPAKSPSPKPGSPKDTSPKSTGARSAGRRSPTGSPLGSPPGTVPQAPAPDPTAPIAVDEDAVNAHDDGESTGDASSGYTTSITSSIMNYKYHNGRRYHAYREGVYVLPNDESEQDRLDLHHHIFRLSQDGNLFRAPITANPQRVLDIGTGTGIWALDFADEFPSATVIGTDLSPIQPSWVPPNCSFYVDDAESDWTYAEDDAFDFIHMRSMSGSIQDWPKLLKQAYNYLKPGGWIEIQDYETWFASDDDSLDRMPSFNMFQKLINEGGAKLGRDLDVATTYKQKLIDAGFDDVHDDIYKVPLGSWPKDPKLKEVGKWELELMCASFEPFILGFVGRAFEWSADECKILSAKIIKEVRDPKNRVSGFFHFTYAQKPLE